MSTDVFVILGALLTLLALDVASMLWAADSRALDPRARA